MKIVCFVLVACGLIILAYGSYELIYTEYAQKQSLRVARTLLKQTREAPSSPEPARNPAASGFAATDTQAAAEKKETAPQKGVIDPSRFKPKKGEVIGILSIPRLDQELAIIEGTGEDELRKGVGHYTGTAFPRQNDQIVLSGHRGTVFRRLGELEPGDTLIVSLPYGDFSYAIENTRIVKADDTTVIRSTAPDEVLVVTTCYPFTYIGNAPERYIITARPTAN